MLDEFHWLPNDYWIKYKDGVNYLELPLLCMLIALFHNQSFAFGNSQRLSEMRTRQFGSMSFTVVGTTYHLHPQPPTHSFNQFRIGLLNTSVPWIISTWLNESMTGHALSVWNWNACIIILLIIILIKIILMISSQFLSTYHFITLAFKTVGPVNSNGLDFSTAWRKFLETIKN